MRKVKFETATELRIKGILGFMQRKVTSFGNGAKVDCPKEYLGKTVYLVVCKNEHRGTTTRNNKKTEGGKQRTKKKV